MEQYILKYKEDSTLIKKFITENGGEIVYNSPILPILSIKVEEYVKKILEESFSLHYIIDEPTGNLQDIEGNLTSIPKSNNLVIKPSLNFSKLRNSNFTGWGTTVAVLDSGVNENWITEQIDITGFGTTPNIDHGTKVANIVKNIAPGARIISYKVCQDMQVSGTNVLQAIDMASQKVDILNLSLGFDLNCTPDRLCPLCESVNYYTQNENKLFIVAAGNHGRENSIQCPGKSQDAITVGAIKEFQNELASYSSIGVPGVKKPNILTSGTIYFNQRHSSGTSFATPIITGISAAIYSYLSKSISKTKDSLYTSTNDIGLPDHHQGFGLFDLDKLLEVLLNDKTNDKSKGQEQN
ncbi:S8 family peptidase [Niallia circulans]|uniref:S8 family peptidase n=1 Tax=Niallia circulans TaxID=1397 RepID=UPI00351745C4